ncbi:MAG TPA: lysophospholipid acyltransferase family protein [Marmoricola sp.]|nr:lysophospholipid acyltransferase family protein [Marmoricola sp.]
MSRVRPLRERRGWAWSLAIALLKPQLLAFTRRRWIHGERIPASGGCIVVANHISHIDPLCLGHMLYDHGRIPRFLGKDTLFEIPFLKQVLKNAQQIPVHRLSDGAARAYTDAVAALQKGEMIMVYPEGSITKDPDGWPMRGKTGAAHLALTTGCPVVPVGQWGAQEVLPPYTRDFHLFPPRTVTFIVGEPVDLGELVDAEITGEVLRSGTDLIMGAITKLVEEARGEVAPAVRFDPRSAGISETGRPESEQDGSQ